MVAAAVEEEEAAVVSAVLATVVVLSVVEGVRPVAPPEVGVVSASVAASQDCAKTALSFFGVVSWNTNKCLRWIRRQQSTAPCNKPRVIKRICMRTAPGPSVFYPRRLSPVGFGVTLTVSDPSSSSMLAGHACFHG